MIDNGIFKREFARVMLTFPNVTVTIPMTEEYYRTLSDVMTTAEFVDACQVIRLDSRQFPPRPGDFLEAAGLSGKDLEVIAADAWRLLLDPHNSTGNGEFNFYRSDFKQTLHPNALFALETVGEQRILDASDRDRDFLRKEFTRLVALGEHREVEHFRRISGRRYGPTLGPVSVADAVDVFGPQPPELEIVKVEGDGL